MAGLKLVAELGGDGSGFNAMMNRAHASTKVFGSMFSGLKGMIAGAFTIGAITNYTRKTIDLAGHLRDVSDSLNINVELLQKMTNAAKLSGGSLEDLQKFAFELNKSRQEAVNKPDGKEAAAFGRLGMSAADISNMPIQDFLLKLQRAFANGADSGMANDLQEVGGRAAKKLIGAFQEGFDKGGPIMSEDVIDQLDEIGDRFTTLGTRLKTEFAPILVDLGNTVIQVMRGLKSSFLELFGFVSGFVGTKGSIKERVSAGMNQAAINAEGLILENSDDDMRAAQAAQNRRRNRRREERGDPGFTSQTSSGVGSGKESSRQMRGPGLQTDSLVGIGNFLGRNPSLVNNIANQQLDVARKQLTTLDRILVAVKSGSGDNGITVPSA